MKLSVIGLGKLGSPMAAVFPAKGFNVIGVDLNKTFVENINQGIAPVDEPELQEHINAGRNNLTATTDFKHAKVYALLKKSYRTFKLKYLFSIT